MGRSTSWLLWKHFCMIVSSNKNTQKQALQFSLTPTHGKTVQSLNWSPVGDDGTSWEPVNSKYSCKAASCKSPSGANLANGSRNYVRGSNPYDSQRSRYYGLHEWNKPQWLQYQADWEPYKFEGLWLNISDPKYQKFLTVILIENAPCGNCPTAKS